MSRIANARSLAAEGRFAEASEAMNSAAAAGETDALFELAKWRLLGFAGPRNLGEAHSLLDRAGAAGHVEAIRLKATLIGNGTGCASDSARAEALLRKIERIDPYSALQLAVSANMPDRARIADLPREILCDQPRVEAIRGLLQPEECRYIMALAEPHLQPSFVVDPATGQRIPHPVRTSSGMSLGPIAEDRVINLVNRRLADVTGTEAERGEPLHVLRYRPGEQYRPHVDFLPAVENQRIWTVLLYLNDSYEGGETRFDLAGVQFAGGPGDALLFRNVGDEGAAEPLSRHAGLPVLTGTKWLATRWIRARGYHPWDGQP